MEHLFGRGRQLDGDAVWQDTDVRFDGAATSLACRPGEICIGTHNAVEDAKGNPGQLGVLAVTLLRFTWTATAAARTNLSIGLACIIDLDIRTAVSRLTGNTTTLRLLTSVNSQRYEFIFRSGAQSAGELFSTANAVLRAYGSSRLYRELKLRGAFIEDGQLSLLPQEQCHSRVLGVSNLASEEGSLGVFHITNVRVVWHSSTVENFNVSIPHLQIKSVRVRESKFGRLLVIETTRTSGSFVLGFRIDPREVLVTVHKELHSLWQAFSKSPILGPQPSKSPVPQQQSSPLPGDTPQEDEALSYVQTRPDGACYADRSAGGPPLDPVYCKELGLAMEPHGATVADLWGIL